MGEVLQWNNYVMVICALKAAMSGSHSNVRLVYMETFNKKFHIIGLFNVTIINFVVVNYLLTSCVFGHCRLRIIVCG